MTPLYLGWQYAPPSADPGPPPRLPAPIGEREVPDGWLAAQRREEDLLARPLKIRLAGLGLLALVLAGCAVAGWLAAFIAVPLLLACLVAGGRSGQAIWRGEQVLRRRVEAERARVEVLRADGESRLRQAQAQYGRLANEWQRQRSAFASQKRWHAVPVPDGIDRVDVAGGTLAGWSAMLTMAAAYQLGAGGEATVIDLSGGAVAADLARLCATAGGVPPAVWVLPHDLPRLDLAASLAPAELADVLALTASATEGHGSARDLAVDTAILDRVIDVLDGARAIDGATALDGADGRDRGSDRGLGNDRGLGIDDGLDRGGASGRGGAVPVRRVTAGLRALAQIGDPRADLAAGLLTEREAAALSTLFGRGTIDRVVLERALGLEAQLRRLDRVGTEPASLPRGRLRVVAVDRRTSAQSATTLGSFAVTALTHLIGRVPAAYGAASPGAASPGATSPGATSWRHTLFLLGAERLRSDVLDRFTDACEASRSGLVIAYRSMPPHVRQRIGRGNAAVAFMRLGNAEDARAASEQIGAAHRFVVSQLTETVGTSVTDTLGGSYTSTVGDSYSAAASTGRSESRTDGTGRTTPGGAGVLPIPLAPGTGGSRSEQAGTSRGTNESVSLTTGISTSTAWGVSTSRATGDSESLARSLQRSRELVVEPAELQRLPVTAMIVSYGSGTSHAAGTDYAAGRGGRPDAGRRVLLVDANPAIGALPVATLDALDAVPDEARAADTGLADTGLADTGLADTGLGNAGR
jgi:hypothetical protein